MKPKPLVLIGMLCALVCLSCRKGASDEKLLTDLPQPGGYYSLNDGEGGYRLGKVVAVEDEAIFTQFYANRWTKRPSLAEVRKAATPIPVAYNPQSFTGMRPVYLESGTVTAEETEAFEEWKKGARVVF